MVIHVPKKYAQVFKNEEEEEDILWSHGGGIYAITVAKTAQYKKIRNKSVLCYLFIYSSKEQPTWVPPSEGEPPDSPPSFWWVNIGLTESPCRTAASSRWEMEHLQDNKPRPAAPTAQF